jgi:BlaI family penicillinase repressor
MLHPPPPEDPADDVTLSELQMDVMRALWLGGERTVAQVAQALRPARKLAHTTVSTLLTRLHKRGLVASRRDGRQLIYRAEIDEPRVRRSMVSGLVGSVFGGDPRALVAHLVDEAAVSGRDLAEIRKLLEMKERDDD